MVDLFLFLQGMTGELAPFKLFSLKIKISIFFLEKTGAQPVITCPDPTLPVVRRIAGPPDSDPTRRIG